MVGRCKTLLRRHQHQAARPNSPRRHTMTRYQHAIVDGSKIFYREAGPKTAPTILLLHGFPTSSYMFRNLIPTLADRYHLAERQCLRGGPEPGLEPDPEVLEGTNTPKSLCAA